MTDTDDFLAHYGVMGMKWGKHKAEDAGGGGGKAPKPVSAEVQAKRNEKAQKYLDRANSYQTQITQINAVDHNFFTRRQAAGQVKDLTKLRDQALADAERKKQGKLSTGQRNAIIGAAVVTALIAGTVVATNIQSGEFTRLANKGKSYVDGKGSVAQFAKNPKLARKDMNPDEVFESVVKHVNPGYGAPGTKVNCRRCTMAYEMRRRGYDVRSTRTTTGNGQSVIGLVNTLSPGEKIKPSGQSSVMARAAKEAIDGKSTLMDLAKNMGKTKVDLPKDAGPIEHVKSIYDALAKEPNGSRGEIGVTWKMGGAHSMAYEIFNGKPVIFDTQTGEKLDDVAKAIGHGLHKTKAVGFTRLDNVPLNEDFLARWVKNVK